MSDALFILTATVLGLVILVALPFAFLALLRHRSRHTVRCPETGNSAEIGLDAAATALLPPFEGFRLAVKCCSLWPERSECGQGCLRSVDDAILPLA
jgi:hypothetical protein